MIDYTEVIVDLSAANGSTNLTQIAAELLPKKLVGVIGRIGRGASTIDQVGIDAIHDARDMGLRYVMGYHFLTNDQPVAQRLNFERAALTAEITIDTKGCLWLDCENDGATNTPIDYAVAGATLAHMATAFPDRCGWYSNRSIGRALLNRDAIFSDCPTWIAIVDGNIQQQADDYGCCLVQYDQLPTDAAPGNHLVDLNYIANRDVLDRLCGYTTPDTERNHMVLFKKGNDVWLWGGAHLLYLGGLPDVYTFFLNHGASLLDCDTDPQFDELLKRANAAEAKLNLTGTLTGNVTLS